MIKRRNFIKASALLTVPAIFGGSGVANAQLCRPTGNRAVLGTEPDSASFFPEVQPYTQPLFIPPAMEPIEESDLATSGDIPQRINPDKHQRYDEFPAAQIHQQWVEEGHWNYHDEITAGTKAGKGSLAWMFSGGPQDGVGVEGENGGILTTPGPTMVAHYGEPVFIRRLNRLPDAADVMMPVGYPAMSTHLHNAHTASESDGYPMDFAQPGDHWDHHYAMLYARGDSREALASLWYHDHMIDFTATNVYAGLSGMAIFYDDLDSGDENDPNPEALRLPGNLKFGGDEEGNAHGFDISLILHDVRFDADGNPTYNVFDTDGHLGDFLTVNRKVMPFMNVKRRKYRFRIYDGGPSRFYELAFFNSNDRENQLSIDILTNDGNLIEEPFKGSSLIVGPANRHDIVIDFSQFAPGDSIEMLNLMEQVNGQGPTGRRLKGDDRMEVMQFRVVDMEPGEVDNSRVPSKLRELPDVPHPKELEELVHREWVFDHDMGLWTVNGKFMDPTIVSAAPQQGTAEVWTFRNAGSAWAHPCHVHFEECQILEWNGRKPTGVLKSRKDVMTLGPNDVVKVFYRFDDFQGRYIIHCHNNVHEDNAMMLRWDIVPSV